MVGVWLTVAMLAMAFVFTAVAGADGSRTFQAALSAENEVPPAGTGATGFARVRLNPSANEVCVVVTSQGLAGTVVAGHIHVGEAGVNGGVVVNLGINAADFKGCVGGVDGKLIKDIGLNPSGYYVNIHTTAVPSGEIRGQLQAQ